MARNSVATDDFNRASLGGNYTQCNSANAGDLVTTGSVQATGSFSMQPTGHLAAARYSGASFSIDQYASVVYVNALGFAGSATAGGAMVCATGADATRSCYEVYAVQDSATTPTWFLVRWSSGTRTVLNSGAVATANGDRVEIEREGTAVRACLNGTPLGGAWTVTDATLTGGVPGVVATAGAQMDSADFGNMGVAPTITASSSLTVKEGDSVTLTVTGAGASQGGNTITLGGLAQTVTAWADTSITVTIVQGTALKNGTQGFVLTVSGTPSSAFNVTLQPWRAGWSYVDISSPVNSGRPITQPDIQTGWQVEYQTIGSKVTYAADGTVSWVAGTRSFDMRVWSPADGWGGIGTQYLALPDDPRAAQGAAEFPGRRRAPSMFALDAKNWGSAPLDAAQWFAQELVSAAISGAFTASITEAGAATESQSATLVATATGTEGGAATESSSGALSSTAAQAESATAADSESGALSSAASNTEATTGTDTQSATLAGTASVTEGATTTDSQSGTATMAASSTEAATATDTISAAAAGNYSATQTEAATAAESQNGALAAAGAQAEAATAGETQSAALAAAAAIAESASAGDTSSALAAGNYAATQTEAATAAETVVATAAMAAASAEAATATDAPSAALAATAAVSEAGTAGDTTNGTAAGAYVASQAESAAAAESSSAVATMAAASVEAAAAVESAGGVVSRFAQVLETTNPIVVSGAVLGSAVALVPTPDRLYVLPPRDYFYALPRRDYTYTLE